MKSLAKPVVLAVLVSAAVLLMPPSAQARHYAWGYWGDRVYQVKAREDGYFTAGTKSAWQFKRSDRHTGKRQVRVVVRPWYLDTDSYGGWVVGGWRRITPGSRIIVTGPLVFGCYIRDGHRGFDMRAQVRRKAHGVWSAPREIGSSQGSFELDC